MQRKFTGVAVSAVVEGPTDKQVVQRVLEFVGLPSNKFYQWSKPQLIEKAASYNAAASFFPWLLVIDLDQDAKCAPDFVKKFLPDPAPYMVCRVAVRAIEAWLLADSDNLSKFLSVSKARIPTNPDREENPKQTMVNLARSSTRSVVRRGMVPRKGTGVIGPEYPGMMIEFVTTSHNPWRPEAAMENSDSLRRCIAALREFKSDFYE